MHILTEGYNKLSYCSIVSAGGAGGGASLMGAPALLSLLPQGGLLQASKAQLLYGRNSFAELLSYGITFMF